MPARTRLLAATLLVSASLSACASRADQRPSDTTATPTASTAPTATPTGRPAPVWGLVGDGAVALVAHDGTPSLVASPAVATPDGRTIVRTDTAAGVTTVQWLDGHTGAPGPSAAVPGHFRPAAVAADGSAVALVAGDATTPTRDPGAIAPGRDRTTLAVVHRNGTATTVDTIAANVVPEAFTSSGGLVVIEYVPAAAPQRYRVRIYDVEQHGLSLPYSWTEKGVTFDEEMQGYQRTHAATSDGSALYTLYSRPVGGTGEAFVHALSLTIGGVYCLDLPDAAGLGAHAGALALAPGDHTLYVLSATGALLEADTGEPVTATPTAPAVTRRLDLGVDGTGPGAPGPVVAVDATTVHAVVGTVLVTVDRAIWRVTARTPLDGPVTALHTTADALQLAGGRTLTERAGTGADTGAFDRTDLDLPDGFGPVRALYATT